MSVYLLAVVWEKPKTRARCSGSARAGSRTWPSQRCWTAPLPRALESLPNIDRAYQQDW